MSDKKYESANKAKPKGNTGTDVPNSPDVRKDGWSAEEIAEQAVHKDGAEVKQEIKQGKETRKEKGR